MKHGWRTMSDGSCIPLTEQEAKAIHAQIQTMVAERAKKLPDTTAALHAISEAVERLRELGWNGMSPKEGETGACCQFTSTGIWKASRHGEYIHFAGCVSGSPHKNMMFKPLAALTDDEKERLATCEEREAEVARRYRP